MKETLGLQLYYEVKKILLAAKNHAYRAINCAMIDAYWNIGKLIVAEEQKGQSRAEYGKKLIKNLSQQLRVDLGQGYSEQSLWNMRKFYSIFPILSAVRRELSWTHYKMLIRVENQLARGFYVKEAVAGNWSTRALERQINSHYYERLLSSKDKLAVQHEAGSVSQKTSISPPDFIKDPYILEFLNLNTDKKYLEKDVEQALIDQLQKFLLELGRGFSFVARQQRISSETKEFYIDLVFYNYILKNFVLVDLKVGELTHQDIGQMDMYVRLYEDKLKGEDDNPTIGIILCAEKDDTVVKYSVLQGSQKLFASRYKLYLPTEKELIEELERERHNLNLLKSKPILIGSEEDQK